MSLINQMLKDIEKRRRKPTAENRESILDGVRVPEKTTNRRRYLLPALCLLAVGLGIWDGTIPLPEFKKAQPPAPRLQSSPAPRLPVPEKKRPPQQAASLEPFAPPAGKGGDEPRPSQAPEPATAASAASAHPPEPVAPPMTAPGARLVALRIGLHRQKLRLVAEFDALPPYAVRPGNEKGELRLRLKGASADIPLPAVPEASLLEELGIEKTAEGVELSLRAPTLGRYETFVLQGTETAGARLVVDLYPEQVARSAVSAPKTAVVSSQPEPVPAAAAPKPSAVTKTPSEDPALAARRLYEQGRAAAEGGKGLEAEQLLRLALHRDSSHLAARELLFASLARQGRSEEAISLLEEGLKVAPGHSPFKMNLARLLLERGEAGAARDVLERGGLPPVAEAPDAHALLAALCRQTGDFAAAQGHYRRLLSRWPRRGLWWMGLGIALESGGEPKEAAAAFRRAIEAGDLREDLSRYVLDRLAVLSRQGA